MSSPTLADRRQALETEIKEIAAKIEHLEGQAESDPNTLETLRIRLDQRELELADVTDHLLRSSFGRKSDGKSSH